MGKQELRNSYELKVPHTWELLQAYSKLMQDFSCKTIDSKHSLQLLRAWLISMEK